MGALTCNGGNKKYKRLIQLKEIEALQFKAQINEEIANATSRLKTAKEQIEMAKEAMELTNDALNQSIERQKLGTAKPFPVFQPQQFYLQAQMDYLKAVSEYNKTQFGLKVAKGANL